MAEYIATLTDDAALQQAAADKYIAAIREKQEKMDAIEALELEDDVAFWNDVKARLAQPVAVETQTEEVATAQAPEAIPTPMAMDDVAVQEAEESTPSVDSSTSNVDSSTSVPESQIENENGNENQFEDNSELGARPTNEVSNEEITGRSLTEEEARELIEEMGAQADDMPMIEFTPEIYNEQFGENGTAGTPIGEVKMGENQIGKLFIKGRTKEYGMIYPTLTNPDIIIEEVSVANNGNTERPSSYVFVKTFNRNGEKIKFFASISVKKDGLEVVISNHFVGEKALEKKLQGSNVRYIKDSLLSNNSDGHLVEHQNDVPDLLPAQENSVSSTAESTTQSSNVQENFVKSGENAQNEGEKDVIEEMREQNRVAEERQQRAGVPPRMSDYSTAINAEDTEAQKAWEDRFNDYLDKLTADDLPTIDSTISRMQGNKEAIKAGNPAGYMENPNYKAFDNIEKMLKKRKRELEKSSTNVEKRQDVEDDSTTGGAQAEQTENANLQTEPTISQESEQVSETDAEERIKKNIKAIKLIKQLLESDKQPNEEQMQTIQSFDGWDGLEDLHPEIVSRLQNVLSDASQETINILESNRAFEGLEEAVQAAQTDLQTEPTISQESEQVALTKGSKWNATGEPEKMKLRSKRRADSHDVVWYIGKKRYGSTTAERDMLRTLAEDYGSLNAVWNAYELNQIILGKNEAAILKKLIETNSSKAELQRGSLSLDGENPAFKAATEKTMQAL